MANIVLKISRLLVFIFTAMKTVSAAIRSDEVSGHAFFFFHNAQVAPTHDINVAPRNRLASRVYLAM